MHSFQRDSGSAGDRGAGPARGHRPVSMTQAWARHLQRLASGPGSAEEAGAERAQIQRAEVDAALRSPSRPLEPALRDEMEQRFDGVDFSGVRVHDGPAARSAAAAVEARAFTSGSHIVDGGGLTRKDWAHELAHTLDQAQGPVPGTDNGAGLRVSHPDDHGERRAVAVAERVMADPTPVQRAVPAAGPAAEPHTHRHAAGPGTATIQRVDTKAPAAPAEEAGDAEAARIIARLSNSIEQHTVLDKMKTKVLAPGTWWPEQWMVEGPARLRKTLDRRVMRGEPFNDQDLADIRALSTMKPDWLEKVGIGTYEEAETYIKGTRGQFKNWLKLPAGRRVLTATLAVRAKHPAVREASEAPPTSPDYTLGRFLTTQAPGVSPEEKRLLEEERDEQIRRTAIDTLHPEGLPPRRRHAQINSPTVVEHLPKDRSARDLLTNVLLVLRHGLQLYDDKQKKHLPDYEKDVIRALAHGGRVTFRIPALAEGESPHALTDFLGITQPVPNEPGKWQPTAHVTRRSFATHRVSITEGKGDEPGRFQEKGELPASLTNFVAPAVPGVDTAELLGHDISGGGLASRDWNGDMVLPNGSWGHMLMVFQPPTATKVGSLMVGIETIGPGAPSPVGYEHDFTSSEATANPESVLHGHKGDKIGQGKLKDNQRLVDLAEMGSRHPSGNWRTFLDEIKQDWRNRILYTVQGTEDREALYRELVGPRAR
ncbi:eCIS core domain-containing protein [Streptomyces sp. 4N509B]|uniref:eCIS core domain-containing protein n=1 Tax=Streptomyces sp. 4N509B TaxID=3457413 RepID=UPI003FD05135